VVENGRITETGTHTELIAANGTYTKYYTIQHKSGNGLPGDSR
jgi:ABC-type multidrug transport system fused ATPase/permease subunit